MKLKLSHQAILLLIVFQFSSLSFAGSVERGRDLHRENCTNCHVDLQGGDGTGIYTREDRKIDSYEALDNQIRRCKSSLGASWPEHQIQDLLTYLNSTFYKFDVENGED